MTWKHIIISPTADIRKALEVIDMGAIQIAVVADEEGRVSGIVSDGDIRRALIRGADLSTAVACIMNTAPITIRSSQSRAEALELMRKKDLRHILVVDAGMRLVNLLTLQEIVNLSPLSNPVVLMAGGRGRRLGELTRDCPKPMLPVGGKPILEIIIDNFISEGFRNFYLCLNYHAKMIRDYFGSGEKYGVDIQYICEERPLGTAGALSLLPVVFEEPCIVMNGDILTRLSLRALLEAHERANCLATMVVKTYEMEVPYGVVTADEDRRILSIEEKPKQRFSVSAGIYALSPGALAYIPKNEFFDMPALFQRLISGGDAASVFEFDDYWVDIGHASDYRRANDEFASYFD